MDNNKNKIEIGDNFALVIIVVAIFTFVILSTICK